MSYKLKSIKAVKKDLKTLHPKLIEEIKNRHFKKIKESPFEAYELGYSFKGLRSYHFNFQGTSYRIIYLTPLPILSHFPPRLSSEKFHQMSRKEL